MGSGKQRGSWAGIVGISHRSRAVADLGCGHQTLRRMRNQPPRPGPERARVPRPQRPSQVSIPQRNKRPPPGSNIKKSQFSQFEPFKERNEERLRDEEVKKGGSAPGGGGADTQRGGSSATPPEYGGGEGRGRRRDQPSIPMMARISSLIKVHFTLKRTYRPHAGDSLPRRRNVCRGNSPGRYFSCVGIEGWALGMIGAYLT